MRFYISNIIGIILIICGASIVARVVRVISLENSANVNFLKNKILKREISVEKQLGTNSEHLLWFIQISDLHLSLFHDHNREYHLEEFCKTTIDVINPLAVLASGDLTDAKEEDGIGSRQFEEEWKAYSNALRNSNVLSKTVWLDIRGNHDNFDVPDLKSHNNFYQYYSIQGRKHQRSYMHTVMKGYDNISFIAVDACLLPGPRRPFNFIGVLTAEEIEALKIYEEESKKSNYTVWFGHYPTSCILSPEPSIREVMGSGLVYLCGHLHTLGGFARNLYTRQQTGSLELELGDWKDSRMFRVAAIDHGLFSFTDVSYNDWPIVLITNPKDAVFMMPHNEPLNLISESTHIRVLVWSLSPVSSVQVRFNSGNWIKMHEAEAPLYVAPWNASYFQSGLHTIEVLAFDQDGREKSVSQEFSLDGSQTSFTLTARILLMSNVSLVFQFLFGMSLCIIVIPLCVIHCIHHLVLEKKINRPRKMWPFWKCWLRKFWILSSVNRLFWPVILSALYIPLGPWFVGEILEDHIGIAFAWGIFVYNSYLPGSLTYAYGFLQMAFYHIPITFLTAHSADLRYQVVVMNKKHNSLQFIIRHFCFLLIIVIQAMNAIFFWMAYGTMAFLMGPLRTWSAFFGIYLWYSSSTLQPIDFSSAASVWHPNVSYTDYSIADVRGQDNEDSLMKSRSDSSINPHSGDSLRNSQSCNCQSTDL